MNKFRKSIALLLVAVMILSLGTFAFGEKTDTSNHWAKEEIQYLMEKGIVSGYPNGDFKPDQSITRAEFVRIVNGVFGYSKVGKVKFKDTNKNDWFYDEIGKAVEAGYIEGYGDNTMKPNSPITRQEASKIMSMVFDLDETKSKSANDFVDGSKIGDWAKGYVSILKDKGYISGYPDKTFKPANPIKRAEAVKIITNASGNIINVAGKHTEDADGNVLVNTSDVVLKDMNIKGDLYLTEGIGEGDVTLHNVIVKGKTYIRGGGENSIIIINSKTGEIVVRKENNNVRVVIDENTDVSNIVINENTILVIKKGAKIESIKVTGKSSIEVEEGAEVGSIEIESKNVEIKSEGDIGSIVSTEDVKINDKVFDKGENIKLDNKPVVPIPSGGGGGGGGSSKPVSAITVNKSTTTLVAGATETITATVEPSNASNKKVTWSSSDTGVATVDANGKIKGVSAGTATITVTSVADSSKKATVGVTVTTETLVTDFEFNESTKTITGYTGTEKSVAIPAKIGGVDVEIIGNKAFSSKELTSVVIPNSVITIGEEAFAENELTSVVIPNSVTTIGEAAFAGNKLTAVNIPNSVVTIGEEAFAENELTSILIPNSVISIGVVAFNDNQLPDDQAFIYARESDGTEDKSKIVSYGGAKRENVIIPNSVKTIGEAAFADNELLSITIPNSVVTIGKEAFVGNKLTEVTIPNSVTTIGVDAFIVNGLEMNTTNSPTGSGTWEIVGDATEWTKKGVEPVTVTGVTIETAPTKVTYTEGEALDLTGLVVTLTKSDSSTEDVAFADFGTKGITTVKADGAILGVGDTKVTISVNGQTVDQAITVTAAPVTVTGVTIKTPPTKVTYTEGEALDLTGLVVTLTKSDSSTEDVAFEDFGSKGITTDKSNGAILGVGDTKVAISVNGKTVDQAITVNAAPPAYSSTNALTNATVTVANGTNEAGAIAALDPTVEVVGTNSETGTATIAWTIASYNGSTAGDYTATGVLTLPTGWTGTAGNVTATVTVEAPADTTPPVITLLGNATVNIANGASYTDAGATALDDVDGNITDQIVVGGDTVDTSAAGTYVITYNVSDAAGNAATEVTRTVVVAAATDTTINIAAIPGVTAPVTGAIPDVTGIDTAQYTGTIAWTLDDEAFDTPFAAGKAYEATITLTAKSGYTLAGVTENFFEVTGATATNAKNDGVVTAVFTATTSITSNIKIIGTDNTEYTLNNLPKGLSWDDTNKILAMNNFQGKYIHQDTLKEITINVVGNDNKLTAGNREALLFDSGITIQGTGTLTLESKHTGRAVSHNTTIQGSAKVTINIDKSTGRAVFGNVTVKDSGKLEVNTVGEDVVGSSITVADNIYLSSDEAEIKLKLENKISTQSYTKIAANIPYIEGKYTDGYYEKAAYKIEGNWFGLRGGSPYGETPIKLTYTVPNSVDKLYTGGGAEVVNMKIWAPTTSFPSITMYDKTDFTNEVTSIDLSTEFDNVIYVKTTIGNEPNKDTKYYIITIIRDKAGVAEILEDKAALTADSIKGENTDLDNIIVALKDPLPSTGTKGSTITWQSNKPEVVSNDGQIVKRPNVGNETVTLTATLTKDGLTETKEFVLTVLELEPSTIVFADAGPITKTFGDPAFTNGVSGDGEGAITYSSGTPEVATVDSSSGEVTIVGVGTTVITASKAATATHAAVTNSYTVQVSQQALGGTITIDGELKFGEKLTANISSLTGNSDSSKLSYTWKRGDTTIGSNQTYTTVADDIGKTITVEVTSSVETGTITGTTTETIGKANGPVAPIVVGATSDEANEILVVGGEEKITVTIGTNMTADYEYSLDGGTTWNSLASGDITGLTSSITSIQIRVKETTTHEAGVAATCDVTVAAESFTLIYTAGTGGTITGTSSQTVSSGGDGTTVTAIANEGYSFDKWSDGVTTAERTDTNVTANITVEAQFEINKYTVTFKNHDDSVLKTETVEHGSDATAPVNPTRTGYTFTGWDKAFNNVTSDLTVKAKYTENAPETFKVTITGDATKTTDYTITGADNLEAVVAGTDLTVTAVTNITVNGDEVAASGTKVIKITETTTITINKQVVTPETYTVTTSGDAVKDTDFEITGAADLTAVAKDTTLTVKALTAITVDGSDLAIGVTKDVVITAATDIVINKQIAVDKSALTTAISEAETNKATVTVSTDGKDVDPANKWVTSAEMTAYTSAISTAQGVADNTSATQTEVNNAVTALNAATSTFDTAKKDGIKAVDSRIEVSEIKANSTITAPVHGATIVKPTFEVTEGSPAYFNLGIANWQKKNEEAEDGWETPTTGAFTEGIWRFRVQIRIDGASGTTHKLKKPFTAVVNSNNWTVDETVFINENTSYGTVFSPEYVITAPAYASTNTLAKPTVIVANGTSLEDAKAALDSTVGVVGTEGETGTADITWTITEYNGSTAGDYAATGVLTLPEGWTGEASASDVTATVTVEAPANTDASLSDLKVAGETITGFSAVQLSYDVELAIGTTTVPTVLATVTDSKATAVVTNATTLPGTTTVLVTAEDGTTKQTYTINFILKQLAPTGLTGFAPTTSDNNDGKITGTTTDMEYKLSSATDWTKVTGTETTGLAAGDYEVRYAAKAGYKESPATTVTVGVYVAPATLESIAITTQASKLVYKIGESLDITGLVVTGTYSDSTTKVEEITTDNVTGFNSSAVVASQTLTITVDGKTTSYTVEIQKADGPEAPLVESFKTGAPENRIMLKNDGTNFIIKVGTNKTGLQYSTDEGSNWDDLNASGVEIIIPGNSILIRAIETDTHKAGEAAKVILTTEGYVFNSNTGTIINYAGEEKGINIPSSITIDGVDVSVTKIDRDAFRAKGLISVIMPNTLKWIDTYAFENNSLESIVIPDSVEYLGTQAFEKNKLTEVTIPNIFTEARGNLVFAENGPNQDSEDIPITDYVGTWELVGDATTWTVKE